MIRLQIILLLLFFIYCTSSKVHNKEDLIGLTKQELIEKFKIDSATRHPKIDSTLSYFNNKKVIVKIGPPNFEYGSEAKAYYMRTIMNNFNPIRRCYYNVLKYDSTCNGYINISVIVDKDGNVIECKNNESTLGNTDLENCVIDKVTSFKFKLRNATKNTKITYPYQFSLKEKER